jgi:hypothetical protein
MRWSVGPKAPDHSVVTAVSTLFGSICRFSTALSFLRSSSPSHQATLMQATPLRERLVSATLTHELVNAEHDCPAANKFRPHHRERRGQRGEGGSGAAAGAVGGEHRHDQDVGRSACPHMRMSSPPNWGWKSGNYRIRDCTILVARRTNWVTFPDGSRASVAQSGLYPARPRAHAEACRPFCCGRPGARIAIPGTHRQGRAEA